jgi:hypothetical protein
MPPIQVLPTSHVQALRDFLMEFEEKMELEEGIALPATAAVPTDESELSYPTALNTTEVRRIAALPPQASSTHTGGGIAGASSRGASKRIPPKAAVPAPPPPAVSKRTHGSLLVDVPQVEPAEFQTAAVPDGVGGAELTSVTPDGTHGAAVDISDVETQHFGDDACGAVGATMLGGGGVMAQRESVLPEAPPSKGCHPTSYRPHSSCSAPPCAHSHPCSSPPCVLAPTSALAGRGQHPPPFGSCSGVILAQSMIATPRRVKSDPVSLHAKRTAQWKLDPYLSLTKKRALMLCCPMLPLAGRS